jgi:hypothetical protein
MKANTTTVTTDPIGATIGLAIAADLQSLVARLVAKGLRSASAISPAPPARDRRAPAARWMTPPNAARVTGVPLKTIRSFIKAHRIEARLRNSAANPKQRKYLVNVDEVARVATVPTRASYPASRMDPVNGESNAKPEEWARGRLEPVATR